MTKPKLATLIRRARKLITDPEHWTQDQHAMTREGMVVYPNEGNAYAWCADGAIAKVCGVVVREDGMFTKARDYNRCGRYLRQAALELFPESQGSIVDVNDGCVGADVDDLGLDHAAAAHANVLDVLDRAAKLAAKEKCA